MKALISGFALLTFLAATTLPLESYAQTSSAKQQHHSMNTAKHSRHSAS